MTFSIDAFGPVVLVIWKNPESADLGKIIRFCEKIRVERGKPAVFVSRIPADSETPDETLRREFAAKMPLLMEHCSSFHAVIEGTGFVATIKRSAVSWISLATGKRGFLAVHATTSAIPATLPPEPRREMSEALRYFEARGLASPAPRQWDHLSTGT